MNYRMEEGLGVKPLAQLEREHILTTVEVLGNIAASARALGISRSSLHRKLKQYAIYDRAQILKVIESAEEI